MSDSDKRWLWYEKPGFVIGAIIVFWPVGLTLMWIQRKFSPKARIALSIAAPVLTAIVVASLLGGSPASDDRSVEADISTDSVIPSASVLTTSTTASGTVGATGSPSATRTPAGKGTKTTGTTTTTPKPAPAPATDPTPPPVDPNAKTRFTLVGTYKSTSSGMQAEFTLKATPKDGIVTYEWWVYSGGSTASYEGLEVSDSHYGLPPTSVRLVMYDSKGKTYVSAASVYVSGDKLTANGY